MDFSIAAKTAMHYAIVRIRIVQNRLMANDAGCFDLRAVQSPRRARLRALALWLTASALLLSFVFPVWRTQYFYWRPPEWRLYSVQRSHDFILNREHGAIAEEYERTDRVIRNASVSGRWQLRTQIDFAANAIQFGLVMLIVGGGLLAASVHLQRALAP